MNLGSPNVGGGYYTVNWSATIIKTAGSGSWWLDPTARWDVNIDGQGYGGWFGYDFRNYTSLVVGAGSTNVGMGGYRNISVAASVNPGRQIGNAYASGAFGIPWVPPAPSGIGIDQITPTSLRYRFSGNGDNGSAITSWEAQIDDNPSFSSPLTVGSSGTTTFTGLTPATTYYCRSRGNNGIGSGPWSGASSAMTASGAYVSINGAWVAVPVYVSDGTTWDVAELAVSNGTIWQTPL